VGTRLGHPVAHDDRTRLVLDRAAPDDLWQRRRRAGARLGRARIRAVARDLVDARVSPRRARSGARRAGGADRRPLAPSLRSGRDALEPAASPGAVRLGREHARLPRDRGRSLSARELGRPHGARPGRRAPLRRRPGHPGAIGRVRDPPAGVGHRGGAGAGHQFARGDGAGDRAEEPGGAAAPVGAKTGAHRSAPTRVVVTRIRDRISAASIAKL
jgi:hypothetical protein